MDDNVHNSRSEPGMLRISRIEVQNFKSLVDFKIDLAKFSCLIGMNGAGKSTVLQFVDFLSQLVRGGMKEWLDFRKWGVNELKSQLGSESRIQFTIFFAKETNDNFGGWTATYDPLLNRCIEETIDISGTTLSIEDGFVEITTGDLEPAKSIEIAFEYDGSILSVLKEDRLPLPILECKELLEDTVSFDLLSPEVLKSPTRKLSAQLGPRGSDLPAVLDLFGSGKKTAILQKLREAYPHFLDYEIKEGEDGWRKLEINEFYDYSSMPSPAQRGITISAQHINDGMLRLIAILAELQSGHQLVLFDEIENGINPELVEFILNTLVTSSKQILVTTHSPMILNYLEDDIATQGVIYLYKTRQGHTKSIPFFSIPSLAEKLKVMGPGEAFVDTNLRELATEIAGVTGEEV